MRGLAIPVFCVLLLSVSGHTLSSNSNLLWPMLDSGAGSYATSTTSGIDSMAQDGLHLDLMENSSQYGNNALTQALRATGTYYLDRALLNIWHNVVCPTGPATCSYNPGVQNPIILAQVQSYLKQVAYNRYLVGFYLLDDAPANSGATIDVHLLLEQIHSLVAQANRSSSFARPTICGFAGAVEFLPAYQSYNYHPHSINVANFSENLVNFTPSGCDVVAIYNYAVTTQPAVPGIAAYVVDHEHCASLPVLGTRSGRMEHQPATAHGFPAIVRYSSRCRRIGLLCDAQSERLDDASTELLPGRRHEYAGFCMGHLGHQ
jgi:hypothetical protein